MEGEAIPPDSVKSFFKMLYTGNVSTTEERSAKKSRLIDSSTANSVICYSTGKLISLNQPPNQLQHQSTALKSKKEKLSRFSKVTLYPDNELEPNLKKRKLSFKFSFSNIKVCPSESYPTYSNIDILWMMAGNLLPKTPIWAGFNTTIP